MDSIKKQEIDRRIRNVLLDLGMPDKLQGHRHLVSAISIVAEDPAIMDRRITKELYPAVAKEHGGTGSGVERNIRRAIETTWLNGDPEVLVKYFGNTVSRHKGKPTNCEFISRMANVVVSGVQKEA